jgi:hypothetical protein
MPKIMVANFFFCLKIGHLRATVRLLRDIQLTHVQRSEVQL